MEKPNPVFIPKEIPTRKRPNRYLEVTGVPSISILNPGIP